MKKWEIPVSWEMCGTVVIKANTLEEALEMAWDDSVDIPKNGSYICGSYKVEDEDPEYVRKYYNDDQEDEAEEFYNDLLMEQQEQM